MYKKIFIFIVLILKFNVYFKYNLLLAEVAPIENRDILMSVDIKKEYRNSVEIINQIERYKILKRSAINDIKSLTNFEYNPEYSSVKIIDTYVSNFNYQTKKDDINKDVKITQKDISSDQKKIFYNNRYISFLFPNLQIDSEIYLHFKEKNIFRQKEKDDNNFKFDIKFRDMFFIRNFASFKYEINSDKFLNLKYNDPHNVLKITKKNVNKNGAAKNIIIELQRDFYDRRINEHNLSFIEAENKSVTWFLLYEEGSLSDFMSMEIKWREGMNEELPPLFKEIMEAALKEKNEEDQIKYVVSNIMKNIQYISDVRDVKKQVIHKSLKSITETKYGDCKDYSISSAAILNQMGYDVSPAFIYSSSIPPFDPFFVPPMNHAIIKIKSKKGKIYWVDTTAKPCFIQAPLNFDANRRVVVMTKKGPQIEKIRANTYKDENIIKEIRYDYINDNFIKTNVSFEMKGLAAFYFHNMVYKTHSIQELIEYMTNNNINNGNISDLKVIEMPDLFKSNVCMDNVKFSFGYNTKLIELMPYKSNFGNGLMLYLPKQLTDIIFFKQTLSFNIDYPKTTKIIHIYKNMKINNPESLNLDYKNKWISIKRVVSFNEKKNESRIEETFQIRKNTVTYKEINTEEFKEFKEFIKNNERRIVFFIKNNQNSKSR